MPTNTIDPLAAWVAEKFFTRGVWFDPATCETYIDGEVLPDGVVWIEAGDLSAVLSTVPDKLDSYDSVWVGYETDRLTMWLIDQFSTRGFWFDEATCETHFDGEHFEDDAVRWIEAGDLSAILELVAQPVAARSGVRGVEPPGP